MGLSYLCPYCLAAQFSRLGRGEITKCSFCQTKFPIPDDAVESDYPLPATELPEPSQRETPAVINRPTDTHAGVSKRYYALRTIAVVLKVIAWIALIGSIFGGLQLRNLLGQFGG
jgi:hypothetical protein